MEIPKTFRLRSGLFTVHMVPRLTPHAMGRAAPAHGRIELVTHAGKLPRPNYAISEAFWHEAVHCILHDMGDPRWRDEGFVTAFSERLNRLVHTAKLGTPNGTT